MQYPYSGTGKPDTHPMGKEVGVRLRHARKLRQLTQVELAKKAGVAQGSISDLETGESKSPHGTNLVGLARVLQVNPEWLATGRGAMDATDEALPSEAIQVAKDWLRLAPEVRKRMADMLREMVRTSSADVEAVPDKRIEETYGSPRTKSRR